MHTPNYGAVASPSTLPPRTPLTPRLRDHMTPTATFSMRPSDESILSHTRSSSQSDVKQPWQNLEQKLQQSETSLVQFRVD